MNILNRFLILIFFFSSLSFAQTNKKSPKQVAVTFDDLPLNIALHVSNEKMKEIVSRLVSKIKSENIPAIAFVNENKLEVNGEIDPERVNILKTWLDAGIELGNHTYSHRSANRIDVKDYEEDILKGERITKELLKEKDMKPRYFRHPFLQTGRSLEVKHEIESFLSGHGYKAAPVTIDNSEWIFASAYGKASNSGDLELMKKIGNEYLEYMRVKFKYYEKQSDKLFGRQINQILLIHSNILNSDYFNELCDMIRGEGYDFISIDEALKDDAYKSPDTFIGAGGISWMDRWALAQGKKGEFFKDEPRTPKYIMDIAGVDSE